MTVYILHSVSLNGYYVGHSANLEDRLERHNQGRSKSTKRGIPWRLVLRMEVRNRSIAMQLENKIKKRGIERWLKSADQPSILDQIELTRLKHTVD